MLFVKNRVSERIAKIKSSWIIITYKKSQLKKTATWAFLVLLKINVGPVRIRKELLLYKLITVSSFTYGLTSYFKKATREIKCALNNFLFGRTSHEKALRRIKNACNNFYEASSVEWFSQWLIIYASMISKIVLKKLKKCKMPKYLT